MKIIQNIQYFNLEKVNTFGMFSHKTNGKEQFSHRMWKESLYQNK